MKQLIKQMNSKDNDELFCHFSYDYFEWYFEYQGELYERKEFIKKYELSDDSDDEDF